MRAVERNRFRKQLEAERQELVATFKRNQAANREGGDEGLMDLADKATEYYTQEFNYSLTENDRARLAQIDEALERIENGEYGNCEECGEKIAKQRLKALPWALLCINCQEEKEQLAQARGA